LRGRQNLLETQRTEIDARIAQVEKDKKDFQDRIRQTESDMRDENFVKTLNLYNELKPKQVKEIFVTLSPQTVEKYLRAMERERAARVIAEFKSTEDRQFIAGILERIRNSGISSATTQPGSSLPS